MVHVIFYQTINRWGSLQPVASRAPSAAPPRLGMQMHTMGGAFHKFFSQKNLQYMKMQTPGSTSESVLLFTLLGIQPEHSTASRTGAQPLEKGLQPLPSSAANNADLTDMAAVQTLLPWNAPKECRSK